LKLSFNATTLRGFGALEAMRHIRDAGYDGVEIALNDSHLHPLKNSPRQIAELKRHCGDIGLAIACIAAGGPTLLGETPYEPSMISADAAGRRARIDVIRRSVELTQRIGCPVINVNSGLPTEDVPPERAQAYLMEALAAILPDLGDTILALEPEPGFFVGTTGKGIEIIDAIDSPRLRLNLDIGHVFCSEDDCYEKIGAALPYARHIHIEDIKGGIHHHEIPGEGDIDFRRISGLLAASGYGYYVSVELHHHDRMWRRALNESREYLLALA
jgi:sugar phosphate isomerase/epimerase